MPDHRLQTNRHVTQRTRRGAIAILAAIFMVAMMGMLAFSIDVGYIASARTEIQRAVDSGAFAAAGSLGEGTDVARRTGIEYVQANPVSREPVAAGDITVEFGRWDSTNHAWIDSNDQPNAVKILARQTDRPLFFGRIFGGTTFDVEAEAVATYRPRDIVIVLDYSASMNDDSELKHINKLGRRAIETNLRQIYEELGSPIFGLMQWTPRYIGSDRVSTVKRQLGLNRVAYPYPSGSWEDYIRYVQTSSTIRSAGYRRQYGYLTLVNYWLERQPAHGETPDLWQTSAQPITAVKDSVALFLAYMQQANTDDRVGLAIYTSSDGSGKLESPLTTDYQHVEELSRQRQAGHYDRYTNIGAGLQKAREELEDHGRPGALKLIVLMTDGIANRPSSAWQAKRYVRREAQQAAELQFPVVTISLGAAADHALMQETADTTGGVHFNIPGGAGVADYEEDLRKVFKKIADDRPLKLVY